MINGGHGSASDRFAAEASDLFSLLGIFYLPSVGKDVDTQVQVFWSGLLDGRREDAPRT